MISGWRVSLLDITQYCALAGKLSSEHGAGRAASVSRAYHARLAQTPDAPRLMSGLTADEQDDVLTWKYPVEVVLDDVVLKYEDAEHEIAVGLDSMGEYVEPSDTCDAVTVGHLDFAWLVQRGDKKIAYVADLKRSVWTPSFDPESLQLHAYGRAYAKKNECDAYVTGCWAAIEGVWRWCRDEYHFDQIGTELVWDRLFYAATNTGNVGTTGPHCADCYSRLHCPEYLLPAALLDTPLALVCRNTADGVVPDPAQAVALLEHVAQMEALADAAKKQLRAMVSAGVLHVVRDRKSGGEEQYVPVDCEGRLKLDEKKLEQKLGDLGPYKSRGAPYPQWRWIKMGEGR